MLARHARSLRRIVAVVALALMAISFAGCKCKPCPCPEPQPKSKSLPLVVSGDGGPVEVRGRARYDKTLTGVPNVRLDLKITQGAPAFMAANAQVWWASHDQAETPVFVADPIPFYEHLYPSDQWTLECIQATHDPAKKFFHVKVSITDPMGYPLGEAHRIIPFEASPPLCQPWYLFPALSLL